MRFFICWMLNSIILPKGKFLITFGLLIPYLKSCETCDCNIIYFLLPRPLAFATSCFIFTAMSKCCYNWNSFLRGPWTQQLQKTRQPRIQLFRQFQKDKQMTNIHWITECEGRQEWIKGVLLTKLRSKFNNFQSNKSLIYTYRDLNWWFLLI